MIKIENWSVVVKDQDIYTAPEIKKNYLNGDVYNHPSYKNGHNVTTNFIVLAAGLYVETASGTRYLLGNPSDEYLEYLESINQQFDCNNPIKFYYE